MKWNTLGTSLSLAWLFNYPAGSKAPPDEKRVKGKTFLEVTDVGVEQIHAPNGGLGIPYAFLYWHWAMVLVYLVLFSSMFVLTTPLDKGDALSSSFPWLTLVHKLVIFFNVWESLGLGVLHGPLHQKMNPPFQDWWYRLTPGTMKYNAPFMKMFNFSMKRSYLDVAVEGVLTYVVSLYALLQPEITPAVMRPVMLCSLYELFFDFGQHMHNYGTQNLHFFMCCCFPVESGQVAGIQLFLTLFYFCSGFCKLGPTFQYFFTSNLLTSFFMVDVPWAEGFRKTFYQDVAHGDYRLKPAAWWLATTAAVIEMCVPLLTWFNTPGPVYLSIFVFMGMHTFIIATLVIDVFVWNFTDAAWFVILYGILGTGVDWEGFANMSPILATWLSIHTCYVIYGHLKPNDVPYVLAHRHAAGNWAQGVLVIKKSAMPKLGKLVMHAGIPSQDKLPPGWMGEWFAFHAFWAYVWNWNLPSRMLVPLVVDAMGKNGPSDGMYHSSGDYWLIHSVLFFDALIAHLRFDGLSNLALVEEVGRVCEFEEGECQLCWAGAFPTFVTSFLSTPKASWKIVDSKTGVVKEGTYETMDVMDPAWKKPTDLDKTKLPAMVAAATSKKKDD